MKSNSSFTREEVDEIIRLIKEKLKSDSSRQKSIRAKIRRLGFYASDYGFTNGYTVEQFLSVAKISDHSYPVRKQEQVIESAGNKRTSAKSGKRSNSDESYILDICDEVLKQKSLRQHRFDFLRGDAGAKLPVDAYYPELNLVIEYKEKQHTEAVAFFDRRQTASGVGRGEQRKIYDQRRREILPQNGIRLIELDYSIFEHARNKKLLKKRESDLKAIIQILKTLGS